MPNYQGVWSLSTQYQAIGQQNWLIAPGAPTGVSASAGNEQATVSFTAPSYEGNPPGITGYRVTSNPGDITATGSSSPITVSGLTNGTAYTFIAQAQNSIGYGVEGGPTGSVTPALKIAIFNGFENNRDQVEQIDFSTRGNSTDFGGDLSQSKYGNAWWGSATRGVSAGGFVESPTNAATNKVEYFTFSSAGNATDFGDTSAVRQYIGALSNSTRGVIAGGAGDPFSALNIMEYFTTASTGNATDFGDLSIARYYVSGVSSPTRGLFLGGDS